MRTTLVRLAWMTYGGHRSTTTRVLRTSTAFAGKPEEERRPWPTDGEVGASAGQPPTGWSGCQWSIMGSKGQHPCRFSHVRQTDKQDAWGWYATDCHFPVRTRVVTGWKLHGYAGSGAGGLSALQLATTGASWTPARRDRCSNAEWLMSCAVPGTLFGVLMAMFRVRVRPDAWAGAC